MATDIEKGLGVSGVQIKSPTLTVTSMDSPNPNRFSQLEQFQLLVGDVDAPPSPDPSNDTLYREIMARERSAKHAYYGWGFVFFLFIFMQITFCLSITVGAQIGLTRTAISVLAATNTAVASVIGILKGLGLPEKRGMERVRLQKALKRIRDTTRRLKIGYELDVSKEVDTIEQSYNDAEEETQVAFSAVEIKKS